MLIMHSSKTLTDLKKYNVNEDVLNVALNLYEIKLKLRKTKDFFDDLNIDIKETIQLLRVLKKVYSINRIRINKAIKSSTILGIDYCQNDELNNFIKEEIDIIAISSNVISILKDLFNDLNIINDQIFY